MGRRSGGGFGFGGRLGRGILGGRVRLALMDGHCDGQPTGDQLHDRGCEPWPAQLEFAPLSDRRGEIARKRDGDPGAVRP